MSLITFANVALQEFKIEIVVPNVIRHSSVYTSKELVHSRGNAYFAGRIGWARRALDRIEEVSAIEAFLAQCYGPVNEFEIPVPRDQSTRFDVSTALAISSVTTNGTFDSTFTASKGLLVGDWVNFGTRLHKIVSIADTTYKVIPGIVGEETSLKWHAPVMRARLREETYDISPRQGYFAGPWVIDVQEVL